MIQATLCFVFRDDPQPGVLLGYKKRGFGMGKYDGFGGKLHNNESLPHAALRELYEESSLTVQPEDLVPLGLLTFIFPYKPVWNQEVHLYVAKKWRGVPTESEEMRPEWFNLDNLPFQHMWEDSHYWIPHLLRREPIHATFILNRDNETVRDFSIQLL